MLEPRFGLLNYLQKLRVLSGHDRETVNAERTVQDMNNKLLELLSEKRGDADRSELFATALIEVGQQHIANYLNCDGGMRFRCSIRSNDALLPDFSSRGFSTRNFVISLYRDVILLCFIK